MNPSLTHIVLNIGGWVLVAAMGGALAWRCLRKSTDPARLLFKLILTAGIIGGTIWLLRRLPPGWWPAAVLVPGDDDRRHVGARYRLPHGRFPDQRD